MPLEPQPELSRRGEEELLASTRLFADVDAAALQDLQRSLQRLHLSAGDVLMQQGEPGDCLYVLVHGRLRAVIEEAPGGRATVGEIARGEVVGEMALFTDEPRSTTVEAVRDSKLVVLPKAAFERLLERHPRAMLPIVRQIIERLRRFLRPVAGSGAVRTVALIPAGLGMPISEFTPRLADALAVSGSTLLLSRCVVDRELGEGAANSERDAAQSSRLVSWLDEQEEQYDYILYESDPEPSNWTLRCLRQADRILAIGRADSAPRLNPIEEALRGIGERHSVARVDLVLAHPQHTASPRGTPDWLAPRQVGRVHHLRLEDPADFSRLGRALSGSSVGLVLGGGGARGFAHVGVIAAMRELGIPIDAIGGTSMGAMIGGFYAMSQDVDAVSELCRSAFLRQGSMLDFTFPLLALTAGRRVTRMCRKLYGELRIEDLWLDFYSVASNLTRARVDVHRNGLLWRGIRSSISLPGIFPPIAEEDDLLVDGGVLNNLPVDVMRGLVGAGTVIAVDVSHNAELRQQGGAEGIASGWPLLARRLSPFRGSPSGPTIATLLTRTTLLGSSNTSREMAEQADLCLKPPVERIGLLDRKAFEEASRLGYEHALRELGPWWASRSAARSQSPGGR